MENIVCKVLNISKDAATENSVYIGRPSKFGNPFVIGKDGTRSEVIAKFEKYLLETPDLLKAANEELQGKDLICYCAPKACHGDILLFHANKIILDLD